MDLEALPDNASVEVDDRLTCPVCENHLLTQNSLGIGWPSDPCEHLVRFETVFSTYRRSEQNELANVEDESLVDQLQGRTWDDLWVIHASPADEQLGGIGWTALYGRNEGTADTSLDGF